MFLGFDFDPENADVQFNEWLESGEDVDLEYLETQRAQLSNMLKNEHLVSAKQRGPIERCEKLMYDYLINNGAVSAPVLRDDALEGDLLNVPFDR